VRALDNLHEQLASLRSISAEIAGLHDLAETHDQALGYCLRLTDSQFAFTGLLRDTKVEAPGGHITVNPQIMDVAAIKGFDPGPDFYELFHLMLLRTSVVGIAIKENRCYRSNDVDADLHPPEREHHPVAYPGDIPETGCREPGPGRPQASKEGWLERFTGAPAVCTSPGGHAGRPATPLF
jgi:hypothetical protein